MQKQILWVSFFALMVIGCATSTRYVNYAAQRFPPKDQFYAVSVYSDSQRLAVSHPYYVIGKVSIEGFVSNGVGPESLTNEAKGIARKRGADAIINAQTQAFHYYGGDELLRFTGELIIFATPAAKQ